MPFRSQSQRGLFYAKAKRGEIPMATVKRWEKETPKGKLPYKVGKEEVESLMREMESILQTEDGAPAGATTTANVATVPVPIGGQAPGSGGGSIKPWGDWDSEKAKKKKLKDFNLRLAANQMPVRESLSDPLPEVGQSIGMAQSPRPTRLEVDAPRVCPKCGERLTVPDQCGCCDWGRGPIALPAFLAQESLPFDDEELRACLGEQELASPMITGIPKGVSPRRADAGDFGISLRPGGNLKCSVCGSRYAGISGDGRAYCRAHSPVEDVTPMMRRPMPGAKPVEDDGTQPYAQFMSPKKAKTESLEVPRGLLLEEHSDSVWVALFLPDHVHQKLTEKYAVGDVNDDDAGMHITLAYYGSRDQFSDEQLEKMKRVVADVATVHAPLEFTLTGSGRFAASPNSDGKVPVILIPSAQGLAALRTDIVRALHELGVEMPGPFDFVPHICVGYVDDPNIPIPQVTKGEINWVSDEVSFCVNPERLVMPLGGPSPFPFGEDVEPEFDILWTRWPGKTEQFGDELDYRDWLARQKEQGEAFQGLEDVVDGDDEDEKKPVPGDASEFWGGFY